MLADFADFADGKGESAVVQEGIPGASRSDSCFQNGRRAAFPGCRFGAFSSAPFHPGALWRMDRELAASCHSTGVEYARIE